MSRQLLLEGPAIEPLLERVRAEHGSGARIVRAERVRVGGVAGFFAKERYEVTVEVADPLETGAAATGGSPADGGSSAEPRAGSSTAPGSGGLHALLAAADRAERSTPQAEFPTPPVERPTPLAELPTPPSPASEVDAPAVPRQREGADDVPPAPELPVGGDAADAPPTAAGAAISTVERAAEDLPEAGPTPSRVGRHRAPGEADAVAALGAPEPDEPAPSVPEPDEPAPSAPEPDESSPDEPEPDESSPDEPSPEQPTDAVPQPLPSRRSRRREAAAPPRAAELPDVATRLERLGVPPTWLLDLPDGQVEALRELGSRLAEVPVTPRRPVSPADHPVVVVLAEGRTGTGTARALALELGATGVFVVDHPAREADLDAEPDAGAGTTPDAGAVAAPEHPDAVPVDHDGTAELVELVRHRWRPVVVLVTVPFDPDAGQRSAARAAVQALGPSQVWAVVDATRRTRDVETWLRAVLPPDEVDAVALTGVAATSEPAAALGLAVPVVLVDGRPATSLSWVSLLAARLTAEDVEHHLEGP